MRIVVHILIEIVCCKMCFHKHELNEKTLLHNVIWVEGLKI